MKPILLSSFVLVASLITGFAQDSLLVEHLQKHIYPLQLADGQLSGSGSEFLADVAKVSPFFLIGESHGMAEIPLFTAALINDFRKYDYRYFATETGPHTAAYLQEIASQEAWTTEYSAFLQSYPWSIPFYGWKEECTMLEAVLQNDSSDEPLIWGLDQEFAGGYRLNLLQLVANATTKASQELAQTYFDKAMLAYEASFLKRNSREAFMMKLKTADFDTLKQVFAGQPINLEHISELEKSTHIYQLWSQGEGFESNRLRAEMMKQHFWDYYMQAKQQDDNPKVIFKFGSNHIYRGANSLNVFDIGNFVSELASQMETSSFHLYVLGGRGTQNGYTPFSESEADKQLSYDASEYSDKIDFTTVLDAAPTTSWSIIDLRPLRKILFNRQIKDANPGLEKIIWSYDAILFIPEVSASTGFH